jgi:endonuclease YncB( thermonuclease family)
MKKLIMLWITLLSFNTLAHHNVFHTPDNILILPIVEVIDGDTIRTSISMPAPLNKVSIRLLNIDSPETTWRAKCIEEKILGLEAKHFLTDYLKNKTLMVLKNFKYGTYAGRIVSDVYVDEINIGILMIQKGYAEIYDKKNRFSWCK